MPTKAELQADNDELRATLERAREIIDEALCITSEEDEGEDDGDDGE
jgi:hypothetical protein